MGDRVVVSEQVHRKLKNYAEAIGAKMGKIAERAICEFIEGKNFLSKEKIN